MLREQMINFLQTTVIFLLITNAFTIAAVGCAIRLLTGAPLGKAAGGGAYRAQARVDVPLQNLTFAMRYGCAPLH